ncbi:MAG: hypothetical protein ACI4P6_06845 [Candidatus Spyradosoma sp.]
MKISYSISAAAAVSVAVFIFTGCTTNPETGGAELFGVFPIEDATIDAAEAAANRASESGGALGVAGTLVASAIALWRRRKELEEKSATERAKAVAKSVIAGAEKILSKADGACPWTTTREELVALLKEEQEKAGTRAEVNALRRTES